jgi:condensin-2 complex subunit D3
MTNSDVPSLTASSSNISITDQDTGFWNDLTRANIPFKSLIALLFHHMANGQSSGLQTIELQKAFKSAGLYFTLVSLPGSSAFKIFHSVLYNKALDILKVALKLVTLCLMSYF